MHHGSVSLDDAQRAELHAILSQHFGCTGVDRLCHVGDGANSGTHFVAYDSRGNPFGLKGVTRITGGAAMEVMAYQLAQALGLPNARGAALLSAGQWSRFPGMEVAVIPWLPESKALRALDALERQLLQAVDCTFARQFGQWMGFALLMGIGDRHSGNWVWAPARRQLCMVDLEECFLDTVNPLHFQVYRELVPNPIDPEQHIAIVAAGIEATFDAFRRNKTLVAEKLRDAGTSFSSPHATADPNALADQWARALGLRS
jgi:hypothetical protein